MPDPRSADSLDVSPAPEGSRRASGSRYFPALDGLRFIAFALVFIHHVPGLSVTDRPPVSLSTRGLIDAARFVVWQMGAYGVPVFFVLSSFLIMNLLLAEQEKTGTVNVRDFYIRRTLRIWPLYFFVLAIATAIHRSGAGAFDLVALAGYLTFTGNWVQIFHPSYYSLLWSISVEEQFYAFSPFVLKNLRFLERLAWGLVGATVLYRFGLVAFHAPWPAFWYASAAHLDSFGVGALVAIYYRDGRISKPLPSVAACLGILLAVLAVVSWAGHVLSRHVAPDLLGAALQVFVPGAVALVILSIVSSKAPTGGTLARPTLVYLGRISFGLYMYHLMCIDFFMPMRFSFPLAVRPLFAVLSLLASVGLAALSYRVIEMPFLRLKSRFAHVVSRAD